VINYVTKVIKLDSAVLVVFGRDFLLLKQYSRIAEHCSLNCHAIEPWW